MILLRGPGDLVSRFLKMGSLRGIYKGSIREGLWLLKGPGDLASRF